MSNKNNTNILLDTIVAEIIWVLSSYYSLGKSEVIEKINALIHLDTIDCNAVLLNKALSVWKENKISYVDSYLVAVAKLGNIPLFSYDAKLKSINSVTVQEP